MSPDIVFEGNRFNYLLDLFDKEVDEEGFIYNPETGERVTPDHRDEPLSASELGVVGHSSEIYVSDEVDSIVEFVEEQHESET